MDLLSKKFGFRCQPIRHQRITRKNIKVSNNMPQKQVDLCYFIHLRNFYIYIHIKKFTSSNFSKF